MPFTNPWSIIDPPNAQAANTAAAEMRQIRQDLGERLESVFDDLDVDPLAFKASFITYLGTVVSAAIFPTCIHYSSGRPSKSTMDFDGGSVDLGTFTGYVTPNAISSNLEWVIDLSRFAGRTPVSYTARVYRDAGANIELTFYSLTLANPPVLAAVATVASASTGWHNLAIAAQSTLIDPAVGNFFLHIRMDSDGIAANSARFESVTVDD